MNFLFYSIFESPKKQKNNGKIELLTLKQITKKLEIRHRRATHLPPHLHKALECVLVTEGTLAIGIGPELYEMKEGERDDCIEKIQTK